jgi:hypothetical protein
MKILKFINNGEMDAGAATTDELLRQAGRILDKACSHDMLGEVAFEAEDGKTYIMTVEAVIGEANPEYVADLIERQKEIEPSDENALEDGVTREGYRRDQAADGLIDEIGVDAHGKPFACSCGHDANAPDCKREGPGDDCEGHDAGCAVRG